MFLKKCKNVLSLLLAGVMLFSMTAGIVIAAQPDDGDPLTIADVDDQSIAVGEEMTINLSISGGNPLTVKAYDACYYTVPGIGLTCDYDGGLPDGMVLDGATFTWTPTEGAEYDVKFRIKESSTSFDETEPVTLSTTNSIAIAADPGLEISYKIDDGDWETHIDSAIEVPYMSDLLINEENGESYFVVDGETIECDTDPDCVGAVGDIAYTFTDVSSDHSVVINDLTVDLSVDAGLDVSYRIGTGAWVPTNGEDVHVKYMKSFKVTDESSNESYFVIDGETIDCAADANCTSGSSDILYTFSSILGPHSVEVKAPAVEGNQAPVLANISNRSVEVGETASFTATATDSEDGVAELTYSCNFGAVACEANIFNSNGSFAWTPDTVGSYVYTIGVTDTDGATDSQNVTITVTDAATNHAPVLTTMGTINITAGNTNSLPITATDVDNDTLSYSADQLPSGATFNTSTRTFSWTPGSNQLGSYVVIFEVEDDGTPTMSDEMAVVMNVTGGDSDSNHTPVLGSIGDKGVEEGDTLSFYISATDADNDDLVYSAGSAWGIGLPAGASFNSSTRKFKFTPSASQVGEHTVIFGVTDTGNPALSDIEAITISVYEDGTMSPFSDVHPGDDNYDAIMFVYNEGIFTGNDDGTFAPLRVINRAETAVVVLEAFDKTKKTAPAGSNFGFSDLILGYWYMDHVYTAYKLDIMTGDAGKSTMRPSKTVNKVEMLRMFLDTADEYYLAVTTNPYVDVPKDEWYAPYVKFSKENNLIDVDGSWFYPNEGMTRADVAELMYRYDQRFGL